MKKIILVIILFLSISIASCDLNNTKVYFGDYEVYHEQVGDCEPLYMDIIFMDMNYTYYLTSSGCTMTPYYIIHEGEQIEIEIALIQGLISMEDILTSGAPFVSQQAFVNDNPIAADAIEVGVINGYTIKRTEIYCDMVVGQIIVDNYDFGFFSSGCSADLGWVGYDALKDGITYNLQQLVNDGELTTRAVFDLYRRDEGRQGSFE